MSVLERVPPQNLEAEQSVLGAMLIDKEAILKTEFLAPEDFYKDSHRKLFETMRDLFEKGEAVDIITVTEELRQRGLLGEVGGVAYLTTLANAVPTAANVEYYARIVQEKATLRRLIQVATEIARRGYAAEEEVEEILDDAERSILGISSRRATGGYYHLKDVMLSAWERIEEVCASKGGITGISTGFRDLDALTSGLQPSDLIVIAARPSMGKTMLCLNLARHAAVNLGIPVFIFSLEMAREQLAQRLLCAEAHVDSQRLRSGFLSEADWPKLTDALGRLSKAPIYIDDTPNLSVLEIRAKARRLKAEHGLGMIIIDYLQLMRTRGRAESRQQEISEVSRSLKALARELEVPVVAASQLSRAVEQRTDKRPLLSDLRESGAIEQDADLVAFIYREDYYKPQTEKKNIAEIIIAKQRNGPVGKVELYFKKEYGEFQGLERVRQELPAT